MGYGLNEISESNPLPVDLNMAAEGIATAATASVTVIAGYDMVLIRN